jgi:DNA topoisomerase IA
VEPDEMPAKKRDDDPDGENHISQRQIFLDWRAIFLASPRWLLTAMLVLSFGMNGFLGTVVVGLVVERFNAIEKAQSDAKWDLLTKLSVIQADKGVKLRQLDDDVKTINVINVRLAVMQSEFQSISTRLARKGF